MTKTQRIKSQSLYHDLPKLAAICLSVLNSFHTPPLLICSSPSGFLSAFQIGQEHSYFWVFQLILPSIWHTLSLIARKLFLFYPWLCSNFPQNSHLTYITLCPFTLFCFSLVPIILYIHFLGVSYVFLSRKKVSLFLDHKHQEGKILIHLSLLCLWCLDQHLAHEMLSGQSLNLCMIYLLIIWCVIASQCCVRFGCTTMGIGYKYT